jgi:3-isopropylmalate/(R)-2-methylmalate dehydratase small subunit
MERCRIWKFGNDVDTDQIISSQYIMLPTIEEMKQYAFESLDKDFTKKFRAGDALVGGRNFGCGSSREQAPAVLKALGVKVIIAGSFARIFFRNATNIGLPLIICGAVHQEATSGDTIEVSFADGIVKVKGKEFTFNKFPDHIMRIINAGGLIEAINQSEG